MASDFAHPRLGANPTSSNIAAMATVNITPNSPVQQVRDVLQNVTGEGNWNDESYWQFFLVASILLNP